jgi:hypothetical protein
VKTRTHPEDSVAPQEGRPTTPQTEALICVCGKPLALSHISWDANYSPHTPEAAAGALPSVEVAARKVYHGRIGYENPHDPDILALGVALYPHRARLAAAPPEASER